MQLIQLQPLIYENILSYLYIEEQSCLNLHKLLDQIVLTYIVNGSSCVNLH